MNERAKTDGSSAYICRFYDEGACLFPRKHPFAAPPLLARARGSQITELIDVFHGGPRLTGNRNYDCAAHFSLDRQIFQRGCTVTPLQLGAKFGIIDK